MADSLAPPLAAVVLAAGAGTRLAPLTRLRPKALCPVGNVPLVDLAIDRARAAVAADAVAVNVHHGREQLEAHLCSHGVHVSVEEAQALGTAGAIGHLRSWLDGRPALILNADAWCQPDLAAFVEGWDGTRVRMLVPGDQPFGPRSGVVASLLPAADAARLDPVPSGLWEVCWRDRLAAGMLETVAYRGPFVDCGTPAQYLDANLQAISLAGGSIIDSTAAIRPSATIGQSSIGAGAEVDGAVHASVVWPGATVRPGEQLDRAIRADGGLTVLVR